MTYDPRYLTPLSHTCWSKNAYPGTHDEIKVILRLVSQSMELGGWTADKTEDDFSRRLYV